MPAGFSLDFRWKVSGKSLDDGWIFARTIPVSSSA
jgi:hypothetical protein